MFKVFSYEIEIESKFTPEKIYHDKIKIDNWQVLKDELKNFDQGLSLVKKHKEDLEKQGYKINILYDEVLKATIPDDLHKKHILFYLQEYGTGKKFEDLIPIMTAYN